MGSPFTARQIAEILTPHGGGDMVILVERQKISDKYSELKSTERWFSVEEFKETGNLWALSQYPEGANLIPGFEECALEAKAWWLTENVL